MGEAGPGVLNREGCGKGVLLCGSNGEWLPWSYGLLTAGENGPGVNIPARRGDGSTLATLRTLSYRLRAMSWSTSSRINNLHSPPGNPPLAVIISFSLAGVPITICTASRCICCSSEGRALDPDAPAASAERTPSGPPTFRTTVVSGTRALARTFVALCRLIHRRGDNNHRWPAVRSLGHRKGKA